MTQRDLEKFEDSITNIAKEQDSVLFIYKNRHQEGILMSVMLANTNKIVRMFSCGDRNDVLEETRYWNGVCDYLKEKKRIKLLVDNEEITEKAFFGLLKKEKEARGDDSISVKLISKEDKDKLLFAVVEESCNFNVFDNDKFMFEAPTGAYSSFNHPNTCAYLNTHFDKFFESSKVLL